MRNSTSRFWVQLIRYAGSGTVSQINENGVILVGTASARRHCLV